MNSTARVKIHFNSNQEAINLYYMIAFKDILERLLYNSSEVYYSNEPYTR